jgi:hypothetical protein
MRWLVLAVCVIGCGARTELPEPVKVPVCGDAIVDPGEECDLGAGNSDEPITFHVRQSSGSWIKVAPLERGMPAASFYDYVGASSFTGLEVTRESRLYLYRDRTTGDLSLIVNHNVFGNGLGAAKMSFDGLPNGFSIALSDDDGELRATGATSAAGDWDWTENTDGGVITGLTCGGNWSIHVTADFKRGIDTWSWVNADTSRTPLTIGEDVVIEPSGPRCRTTCTVPKCD